MLWRTWVRRAIPTATAAANSVAPAVLSIYSQCRIREIMVRELLLSSSPLTTEELLVLVQKGHSEMCNLSKTVVPEATQGGAKKEEKENVIGTTVQDSVEYLRELLMSAAKGSSNARDKTESCSHQVESTVRLLLSVDPQFRISPAGYVCYPTLPSLFIASSNVEQNEAWMQTARRLVCTEAGEKERNDSVKRTSCWNYMMSLWCMLDALSDTEWCGKSGSNHENPPRATVEATAGCGDVEQALISQHLLNHWVNKFDERGLPALMRGGVSPGAATRRRGPLPLELRESVEGNDALRRWCMEAKEGSMGTALMNGSLPSQSATLLRQINEQVGYLFALIIAAPITLGRLSVLIQWDSLPFAAHYRSLLHFLLLYTGNPAVAQMEQQEMRRREAHRKWTALLWTHVHENWNRQRQPRHVLSGRYASREFFEDMPEVRSEEEGERKVGNKGSSVPGDLVGVAKPLTLEAEQYKRWMQSSSGPIVNPKLVDICRCIFLHFTVAGLPQPLDVTTRTPSEVMESLGEMLEDIGANDIVVFGVMPFVFERRICRVVRLWWAIEGRWSAAQEGSSAITDITITVRRLCQLCLWEHEYGAATASRMMLHYLQSLRIKGNILQLVPPSAPSSSVEDDDVGRWVVVFRSTGEGDEKEAGGGI